MAAMVDEEKVECAALWVNIHLDHLDSNPRELMTPVDVVVVVVVVVASPTWETMGTGTWLTVASGAIVDQSQGHIPPGEELHGHRG